jgi:diguanylate cyclase (GGDEF)-like protein
VRRILELCVEMDRIAFETYTSMASACPDEDLSVVFRHMAREERQHIDWWSDLLLAWESGLIPDLVDEHDVLTKLTELRNELDSVQPQDFSAMGPEGMLDVAARLEFFMLDPIFAEIVDLMQPGNRMDHGRAYTAHIHRLVEAIESYCDQGGLAQFLARVLKRSFRDQQRLAALATRDQLTGLLNRRGLLGHLKQWSSWSARYNRPLSVLLLDIDRFKTLNDTLGHAAGDLGLQTVAGALQDAVRDADLVGRFGGDEFLILSPETGQEDLQLLMERVVERVRAARFDYDGRRIALTVSVGGSWTEGATGTPIEAIIAAADRSLYAAKEAGRDRAGEATSAEKVGLVF